MKLDQLFRAKSVAILGASDKNPWSAIAAKTLTEIGYEGTIHLVNRRGTPALGRETIKSCADAEGGIDAAFVAVPAAFLGDALEDMAAGGVKCGAVVTSGFAEVGEEGAQLQKQLFERARELDLTLLGPNSIGFTNFEDGIALGAMPMPNPATGRRRVAIVSQSGATTVMIAQAAHAYNVPLTHAVAMGNEAMVGLSDVLHFMIEDEATKAICVFAESIRDPEAFLNAAKSAHKAKKAIVMLKVGVGELTAAVAQAHTGALVGDDKVFQAMCDAYNIVRVGSLEDLVITANTLAAVGPIDPSKGCAAISISGGACEIIADRGEEVGIPFPQFSDETREKLSTVLADFGASHNPLDITGAAMSRPELFADAMRAIDEDGQFGFLAVNSEVPSSEAQASPTAKAQQKVISDCFEEIDIKGALWVQTLRTTSNFARAFLNDLNHPLVTGGLDHSVRATGRLWQWSRGLEREIPDRAPGLSTRHRPTGELELLGYLSERGMPVIPQTVAHGREEAVAFANKLDGPVVLKVLSADIAHKTEVGGVLLNLAGTDEVAEGYDRIIENVKKAKPDAHVEGILVSPMRSGGHELILGIARDPEWGLVLALGMGGVWVELLKDTQLRLLPVTQSEVVEALTQLKAAKLLTGYRGGKPTDFEAIAEAVTAFCNAAMELGDDLEALEVNPLLVDGDRIEALDALAIWRAP